MTVLFGLVMMLWSVAVPKYRAPDEGAHLDLVLYLAEGNDYPNYDGRFVGRAVGLSRERQLIDTNFGWPRYAAEDAPPRTQRPDVDDLGGTVPDDNVRHWGDNPEPKGWRRFIYNQMPQHPPLYYQAMASVLRVERKLVPGNRPPPLDRELALLRLINVLMLCPLPFLVWLTARRMGTDRQVAIMASFLPLGLPQLTHIGASLNNDNLLTLLSAVLAVLLAGVARGRRTWKTDVAVGIVIGLAMWAKAFALVLIPWAAGAYLCAWLLRRDRWRETVVGLVRAGALAVAVGAWWWVRNIILHGEPAPTSESISRTTARRPVGFEPDGPIWYAGRFIVGMANRTWAWVGFGDPKIELPPVVVIPLTVLALLAIVTAVVTSGKGGDISSGAAGRGSEAASGATDGIGPRRRELWLALLPTALLTFAIFRRARSLYTTTGTFAFVQGRYLYAAITPLFVMVAIGAHRVLGRRATPVLLAVVVVIQSWMLQRVLRASWGGDNFLEQVDSMLAWGAWPEPAVLLLAVATLAALAVTVWTVADGYRSGPARLDDASDVEHGVLAPALSESAQPAGLD